MSAKHGNPKRADEGYETPGWCAKSLLSEIELPGGLWLEPCAGTGNIIRAVQRPGVRWHACEIRPECEDGLKSSGAEKTVIGDFFDPEVRHAQLAEHYSVALTNPPFSKMAEFINACREIADHSVFLLRLNVLEGAERAEFWRNSCPDVLVLPNRPSFTGGGTDATAYAWVVFHGQTRRTHGHIRVLAPVPVEERSNHRP